MIIGIMKIGFDAKRAIQNNTGLGNYSRYVVEILSQYYKENDYFLYAPKKRENSRLHHLITRENIHFKFPCFLWKLFSSFWRTFFLKEALITDQMEIFHGLSNELPVGIKRTDIPTVVTIHDLIFLRYPNLYAPIDRWIYRLKYRYSCTVADQIIAISECTKRELIAYLGLPDEKIAVIYQGCHSNFKQTVSSDKKILTVRKYKLPARFLLYVGTIEERKNLLLIVKALQYLNEDIHLVAVGKRTNYQTEVERFIKNHQLSERVHFYPNVLFDDLPAFYQLAQVFIFPSRFEGFGLPVIEALTSGVPVIAAKGSCLEEAGGKHTIYIDPDDDKALADHIHAILDDELLACRMAEEGKKYVMRFSDETIAKEMMNLYRSIRKKGMKA